MTPQENAILDSQIVRRDLRAASNAFPFKLCCDLEAMPAAKRWIKKGLLARGERSAWIAAPGGLKSALLTSLAVSVASDRDWFGHRSKGAAGVVYFALERSDLVERRIKAEILRAGLPHNLPIAVVPATFDLVKPDSCKRVLATLRDAETCFGVPVGLAIFDTYAKVVAAAGGDENQAKDVGPIFANLERLQKQIDIHAALVSHVGKDESRGARGSTALPGDLDIVVQITGDDVRTASIVKANDYPEGPLFSFKSEVFEFGTDEDGDPVTVNIISDEQIFGQAVQKPKTGWPRGLKLVHDAVAEAIGEQGKDHLVASSGPAVKAVAVAEAREVHRRQFVSTGDGDRAAAERQAWSRNFKDARNRSLISGEIANGIELIWIVRRDAS